MPCTVHVRCNYVAYFCPGQHCDDTTRHDGGDSATGRRRLDNDDTSTQATNDNRRQTTRPDETCIATQRNRVAGLAGRAQAGRRPPGRTKSRPHGTGTGLRPCCAGNKQHSLVCYLSVVVVMSSCWGHSHSHLLSEHCLTMCLIDLNLNSGTLVALHVHSLDWFMSL